MLERQKFIDRAPDSGMYFYGHDGSLLRWEINDLTIILDSKAEIFSYYKNEPVDGKDEYTTKQITRSEAMDNLGEDFPLEIFQMDDLVIGGLRSINDLGKAWKPNK